MLLDEKFPLVDYDMIANERDNPYTFASFHVPKGWWYCTDSDPEAKYAREDLSIHMPWGELKMVDPGSAPVCGVWYYWV